MRSPYVLVEGLDVSMFPSLEALVAWVEAQDVRDGAFEAFDADGRELILAAESDDSPVTADAGEPAGDRLRARLIAHVDAIDPARLGLGDADLRTTDLASLLASVWSFHQGGRSPRW